MRWDWDAFRCPGLLIATVFDLVIILGVLGVQGTDLFVVSATLVGSFGGVYLGFRLASNREEKRRQAYLNELVRILDYELVFLRGKIDQMIGVELEGNRLPYYPLPLDSLRTLPKRDILECLGPSAYESFDLCLFECEHAEAKRSAANIGFATSNVSGGSVHMVRSLKEQVPTAQGLVNKAIEEIRTVMVTRGIAAITAPQSH